MRRRLPAMALSLVATLGPACVVGCSNDPVVADHAAGGGGSGGAADAAAGSGGTAAGAGQAGSDAGQAGSDAGQAGSDAGQAGSDAGQAGSDAGQAGSDAGQAGGDAGQAGSDAGQAGSAGTDAAGGVGGTGGSTGGGIFDCPILGVGGAAGSGASTDAAVDANASGDAATDAAASSDAATTDAASADGGADAGATVRVRIVAANITSDNYQAYEPPGIRIFQGLAPDIVMVQEFNYRHGTLRDLVNAAFGVDFCFFREPQTGGIPNGVVSRYPIIGYGEWQDVQVPDRDFAWTRIDVPGPVDLWAVSVHMKTSSSSTRAAQAQELVGYVQAHVPSGDYLVIGGDLNTASTTETAVSELSAVVTTGGARPVDQIANDNTNANRNKPYDWVLPNAALAARELPVQIGASTYPSGLVFDSRVYTPLSEVTPVQAGDSGVNGMQHMPVVKDFELPATP